MTNCACATNDESRASRLRHEEPHVGAQAPTKAVRGRVNTVSGKLLRPLSCGNPRFVPNLVGVGSNLLGSGPPKPVEIVARKRERQSCACVCAHVCAARSDSAKNCFAILCRCRGRIRSPFLSGEVDRAKVVLKRRVAACACATASVASRSDAPRPQTPRHNVARATCERLSSLPWITDAMSRRRRSDAANLGGASGRNRLVVEHPGDQPQRLAMQTKTVWRTRHGASLGYICPPKRPEVWWGRPKFDRSRPPSAQI